MSLNRMLYILSRIEGWQGTTFRQGGRRSDWTLSYRRLGKSGFKGGARREDHSVEASDTEGCGLWNNC